MSESPRQAEAIHAWLRIYLLNWQEGHQPSPLEMEWIARAMRIAHEGGSLGPSPTGWSSSGGTSRRFAMPISAGRPRPGSEPARQPSHQAAIIAVAQPVGDCRAGGRIRTSGPVGSGCSCRANSRRRTAAS